MTTSEMLTKFYKLSPAHKIVILTHALDYMQQYNGRSKAQCICLAMGYEESYDSNDTLIWVKP